jgi:hypothetical protein
MKETKVEIVVSDNQVVAKSTERVIGITKNSKGINVVHFKTPTSIVGKELGVKSYLSEDELIKNSVIGLSDEAILDLHISLSCYVEEILGVTTEK